MTAGTGARTRGGWGATMSHTPAPLRAGCVAFLLAVCATSQLESQCPDGTPPPCAAAPRRPSRPTVEPPPESVRARQIMILPFRNLARAPAQGWLVEASTAMFAGALRVFPELVVAPDEQVFPALRRQGLAPGEIMDASRVRHVAEETGGWTAVYGEILALPTRMVLSARATDVVTGRQLGYATVELGLSEDIRLGFDSLATRLLGSLGAQSAALPLARPAAMLPGARP
jgi:TolB-like protein